MTATAAASALENFPEAEDAPDGRSVLGLRSLEGGGAQRSEEPGIPERLSYQPSLFRDGTGSSNVIPIPTLVPSPSNEGHSMRRVRSRTAVRPRRALTSADPQSALEFPETALALQSPSVGDMIYCDAPVALPGHRLLAAAVDTSMVLIGLGIFLMIFFLGGDLVISRQTAPFLLAVGAVIALFYRSIWYFGNRDTPGMRFAGLQLVDFDGKRPDRDQRAMRQIAGILSLMAAGLGLVWALVDEESLTWHDHISKTFPTPVG
jgi:uncharacterized RDD family membrane protein YckC